MPTSTRIVKTREIRKRNEVKREKVRRARVAALMVDLEGGWYVTGADCLAGSEETSERAVWRRRRVETISGRAIRAEGEVGLIGMSLDKREE